MIKISLIHDHYNRTAKGEDGPVEVRVTINRKAYYISTGVRVRKERLVGNAVRDMYGSQDADRTTDYHRATRRKGNKPLLGESHPH